MKYNLFIFLFIFLAINIFTVRAQNNDLPVKTSKNILHSIRLGKDDMALTYLAKENITNYFLGNDKTKIPENKRTEFYKLFTSLIQKIMFPKVRDKFKNFISLSYDQPKFEKDYAWVPSVIIFESQIKKEELKLQYKVIQENGKWLVTDLIISNVSLFQSIRDDQIIPLMNQGGIDYLLEAMRAKENEFKKK